MEDEEFSMYENRFGSRDLSLQAAAAAESLNSTSFLDQIDDGIGELRDWAEQLERNPSSSRVFDVDKTGLGVRAAYVHPSSASSSLIDQSDDDMGGRQSTTLWNADNPSSSRVFDVDKTGLGARAAHIHLSSTRSSAAIHGMEEDDSEEKDEENEGGRGGDQGSVFLDDSGKYFYHRPLESCNEDLSMFLLGRRVVEEKIPYSTSIGHSTRQPSTTTPITRLPQC
ncbi:hypothetical protein PRIPAC_80164 [Pristionchus pacificus]|uniref:Uncharacterized protein n=1 Tax=Pristionchus pacificus TaxID=54126 RepID=A0A2A6C3Y5_PRIPA|nr:hypothetical protein PRIPAC_80164 [Pristionchus pacificus]|eukprot:PDM72885.1 hypothetical protein PRIPAC_39319 [Pristionchus pacificus]